MYKYQSWRWNKRIEWGGGGEGYYEPGRREELRYALWIDVTVPKVGLVVVDELGPVGTELGDGDLEPGLQVAVVVDDGGALDVLVAHAGVVAEAQDVP